MKVIFLDIDGVLNNRQNSIYMIETGKWKKGEFPPFDVDSVKILLEIVEETGAVICLSSAWRSMGLDRVAEKLAKQGLSIPIKNETPYISDAPRGWEIERWMAERRFAGEEIESYLIIDDDGDMMLDQANNFIQTNFDSGLKEEHKQKAISILNMCNI